jgi:hypothetical protein
MEVEGAAVVTFKEERRCTLMEQAFEMAGDWRPSSSSLPDRLVTFIALL